MGKFGWPVIVSMIEERGNYIEESLKKADEANAALANIKADGERLMAEAKNERLEMLKEASPLPLQERLQTSSDPGSTLSDIMYGMSLSTMKI